MKRFELFKSEFSENERNFFYIIGVSLVASVISACFSGVGTVVGSVVVGIIVFPIAVVSLCMAFAKG
ncbi:MAG: hypothetical protein WCT50_03985 [Patescibacteria group bacterium]